MYYRLRLLIIVAIILHIVPTGLLAQTPTRAPILLPTTTPTPKTPTPSTKTVTVLNTANLRAGPGTTFAVVGSAQPGDKLVIVGANPAGDWYQTDKGAWIAAFLVEVPAVPTTPTKTPTPRPTIPLGPADEQVAKLALAILDIELAFTAGLEQANSLPYGVAQNDPEWVANMTTVANQMDTAARLLQQVRPRDNRDLYYLSDAGTQFRLAASSIRSYLRTQDISYLRFAVDYETEGGNQLVNGLSAMGILDAVDSRIKPLPTQSVQTQ